MPAQFNILPSDPSAVALLQQELGLPRFVAETLVVREVKTVEQAERFLYPSLDRDWVDPYCIPGLQAVVDALEQAVKEKKHIVVFGDFDLDGISATALLTRGLKRFGARVTPFIPLRFEEGYGLSEAALERVFKLDPGFIVTVDCGISSGDQVSTIRAAGIGFAVTDHHEPADLVPEGIPIADPKLDAHCPSTILAGAGVALKVVQALGARLGEPHAWQDYTDLATLGTIADLMPMRDENRALVADGVSKMNAAPRPCIAALLAVAGAHEKPVAATNLSYSIIPRLNAAGRMGDARTALDLLLENDFEKASKLASELEAVNNKRRTIEAELSEIAKAQALEVYDDQRVLVVAGEGWHEGVKGIVASRLVSSYGVPALLFTIDGDEARGSGRSVGQVNLFKAVESISDILTRFGGHEAAVGVTLPAKKLPEFTERLHAYMKELPATSFHPRIDIDSCVELDELTLENVEALQALAPFGQENQTPRFLARDIMLTNCRPVGADKNHFSCVLSNGRTTVAGIMFHCKSIDLLMECNSVVNAAFEVQVDEWRGRRSVKALLSSLAPTKECACLEACLHPEVRQLVSELYQTNDSELCANCEEDADDTRMFEAEREKNREQWKQYAHDDPAVLEAAIIKQLIGDKKLHASQRKILDELDRGHSVLAVMATGRGKSLTFYVHAVKQALQRGKASIFVYPLRALIADQAFHISEALQKFGIVSAVLTGESTREQRKQTFEDMRTEKLDIILTTPEFLTVHAKQFALHARIGFAAIDEAHHIGLSKAGGRAAYASLGKILEQLGSPTALALTATANTEIAQAIQDTLNIDACVFDDGVRDNLCISDQRAIRSRENYLANLIASGEKTVIYVNSREQSVALARSLRKLVSHMASMIGFYNAGLSRSERKRIEHLFRVDALCVLVATSAFGEGIDIPNIRHVVLYHLPFNEIEFNQMSGRAGRDGATATIHLLFGKGDKDLNQSILSGITPNHDCMAQIYRELRRIQQEKGDDFFTITSNDLAAKASRHYKFPVSPSAVMCGIMVFYELGLIEVHHTTVSGEEAWSVYVAKTENKVELADSVRYREGTREHEIFRSFYKWVMSSTPEALQLRISQPILPHNYFDERGR